MARNGKLKELAAARDCTVDELVLYALNTNGSKAAAARHLGVNVNTISSYLKRRGIAVSTQQIVIIGGQHE